MRRASRRDDVDGAVAKLLRAHGIVLEAVNAPGAPDYAWAWKRALGNKHGWLEVKSKGGSMTPAQVDFHERWEAQGVSIPVVESPEEAQLYFSGGAFRTYRHFPWDGVSTEAKELRLRLSSPP